MSVHDRPVDPRKRKSKPMSYCSADIDTKQLGQILNFLLEGADGSKKPVPAIKPDCVVVTLGHATWNLMPSLYMFHYLVSWCKKLHMKPNLANIGKWACRMMSEERATLMYWLDRYSCARKIRVVLVMGPEDIKANQNLKLSMHDYIFADRLSVEFAYGLWDSKLKKYNLGAFQKKYPKMVLLADKNHFAISSKYKSKITVWPVNASWSTNIEEKMHDAWISLLGPIVSCASVSAAEKQHMLKAAVKKISDKIQSYKAKREEDFLNADDVSEKLFRMFE